MQDFLSNSLFHSTRGRYFTDTRVVGIDFIATLFAQGDTVSTLMHETVHAFLCNNTEMGIVFTDIEKNAHKLTDLSRDEQNKIVQDVFNSQQMLQEGYSTYLQFSMLKKRLNKEELAQWQKRVPDNYKRWMRPFLFSFKLSDERRGKINQLVALAMNTHIRKDIEKYKLLDNQSALAEYLNKDTNNPSIRIKKMLKTVKLNPTLLDGNLNKISELSGVSFFEPITKKDIAKFINYLNAKVGITTTISEEQIGDAPSVDQIFNHVQDNTLIANLNLNLEQNAINLSKLEDVIHYSDTIERIIAIYHDDKTTVSVKALQKLSPDSFDDEPELTFILQTQTGEKYLYSTSAAKATELLNGKLSKAILGVKFGDYNFAEDKIHWLPESRSPDLVIFNHYWQMGDFLSAVIKSDEKAQFDYCHIGFGSAVLNTLLVKVHNKNPLLSVNIGIPAQVGKVLDIIKDNSTEYSDSFIEEHKLKINSHLILWSGFDHRIDWVDVLIKEFTDTTS